MLSRHSHLSLTLPLAAFALLLPTIVLAQAPPPKYGPPLNLAQAEKVMAAARAEAEKHEWPVAIAIVDNAGFLVLFQKLDNTQLGSVELALEKARSSALFRRSTRVMEQPLEAGGLGLRVLRHPGIPIEGGLPLLIDGKLVGAIGVSGVKSTEDAEVGTAGANALLPPPPAK